MKSTNKQSQETWGSQMGVIMAVAGSAIGLSNFLRFPGQAAQYGGGAFMLAYFISFLIIGLPLGWADWTMGRYAGKKGFHSSPGITHALWKHPAAKYVGVIAVVIPTIVYCFYAYVQAWCLGYSVNFLIDGLNFSTIQDAQSYWANFVGIANDGAAIGFGINQVGGYLLLSFTINFFLVYQGLNKGIEFFAKWSMPVLVMIGIIVLIRVLTLGTPDTAKPENNIQNGLGFMWNPNKVILQSYSNEKAKWVNEVEIIGSEEIKQKEIIANQNPSQYRLKKVTFIEQLKRPQLWLAASAQLFFSLCVGTGVITVFASYMKKSDDVVLSNLTATSANEFCEVGLGGLITIPAGYAFLGAAGIAGQGIFGLGFNILPMVFSKITMGWLFGFLFFFLLFIAAVTSVLSMLQPGLAFLQETLRWKRNNCLLFLFALTSIGTFLVFWFTKDLKLMDTLNFWGADFLIFSFATFQIILFSWIFGVKKGFKESQKGAAFPIPRFFGPIFKYVCPVFMLTIFILWIILDVCGLGGNGLTNQIKDLVGNEGHPVSSIAWLGISLIIGLFLLFAYFTFKAKAYKTEPHK